LPSAIELLFDFCHAQPMAGGMNRRGSVRTNPSLLACRPAARSRPRRHCWVLGPDGAEWPGLVLEWRRDGGTWHARVMSGNGDGMTCIRFLTTSENSNGPIGIFRDNTVRSRS
jgi:hypothetical protein